MSTVRDNPALHRFELDVDGVIAFSEYSRKPGVVTFIHTLVPDELGGKGVGSKLARGALDLVRARGEKVIAKCPFIAAFIKKHAEYQDLLAEPL
ncbi:MAG: GNAT family N-acetyltransferase [Alphaproteobacteria bacterium]|jgi:predicted GNAT family acetyltransferase|nr:GNAT family N-acetyltransferase [Alphaproteobacteria bacterium]